ncbi:MAG: ArsR family transcriptional regulator [Thermomicrobiales bacterium]
MPAAMARPTIIIDGQPCCTPPGAHRLRGGRRCVRRLVQGPGGPHAHPHTQPACPEQRAGLRSAITDQFLLGQPTISHHLKVLRDVRFVVAERRGTFMHYQVNQACLAELPEAARRILNV